MATEFQISSHQGPQIQKYPQEQRIQDDSILDYSSLSSPSQFQLPQFPQIARCKSRKQAVSHKTLPTVEHLRLVNKKKNKFLYMMKQKLQLDKLVQKLLSLSPSYRYKHLKQYDKDLIDNLYIIDKTQQQTLICQLLLGQFKIIPGSITSISWNLVQNFVLLLLLFMLPFSYAFQVGVEQIFNNSVNETGFIVMVEFAMLIDMFVHCNTGYMYQGEIVQNHSAVFKHYVKQDLIYDAVSFISLQIPLIWSESVSAYVFITATVLFFCLKISIVQKSFTQFRDFLNLTEMQNLYLDLLILIFKVTIVAHIFACVWHASAQFNLYNRNWLISNQIDQESIWVRYNYSFYWASATMITVGYGDIAPTNDWERLVANFTMYIGCGVFAFSLNGIGLILSDKLKARKILDVYLLGLSS